MGAPLAWLPQQCLTGPQVAAPFARAVDAWSKNWIAIGGWSGCGNWLVEDLSGNPAWTVLRDEPSFRIYGTTGSLQDLSCAILALKNVPSITAADKRVLRGLSSRALDDLVASVEGLLGAKANMTTRYLPAPLDRGENFAVFMIGDNSAAKLAIEVSAADLSAIGRSGFARSVLDAPLASISDSCSEQSCTIAAHLGDARLTFEELANLEIGDIVILDRATHDHVELEIAGSATGLACEITDMDGTICLKLKDNR